MAAKTSDSAETHFLNVDLDIYSKGDLQPLVKAFGSKVHVLYVGRESRKYGAHLEVSQHTRSADADSTLRTFCRLIERLPERERSLWKNATVRSFSIGIRSGTHPNPCDFTIQPGTVKAVSEVAAQIVLTIYPPE
jgi:hypothetical protein